jgi:uncharacterized membrane protein HdeD (DUF308 family)
MGWVTDIPNLLAGATKTALPLTRRKPGGIMIILGIALLVIGFLTKIPIVWTLGIVALVVGLVLVLLSSLGHAVGGRRHYF